MTNLLYQIEELEERLFLSAVGNPSSANGWSTTSAVTVSASSEKVAGDPRPVIRVIDGSGLDAATGLQHTNVVDPNMYLSGSLAASAANPNPGTVAGSHWVRFGFNQVYALGEMWIWNYNELNYPAFGMKTVTIQYSATGGSSPGEWQTIYSGDIPEPNGLNSSGVNKVVDFGGAQAKYVVITAAAGASHNWSNGLYEESGLSEVRFNTTAPVTGWRAAQYQNTLSNSTISATFQAGLIDQVTNPSNNDVVLSLPPAQLSATQAIFGSSSVNLDSATVSQTVTSTSVATHLSWANGTTWDLNWSLSGNDLVLQTSAHNPTAVSFFGYTLPNGDIANHTLVTVDTNGTGWAMNAPFTGSQWGGTDPNSMPDTAVAPLAALFRGANSGLFVEGRDPALGPSNIRAFGTGQNANVVASRSFDYQPTTSPALYEIRLRTYHGAWQDAVDPYIAWMQTGLGMVPIAQKPQTWIQKIKTQAYITVGDYTDLDALAQRLDPTKTFLGRQAEYRYYAFDVGYPDYRITPAAAAWVAHARSLGFHVGVHVNVGSVDRSNTTLLQQMQPGLLQVGTDAQGNPIWDGTVNNAYVSSAYAPWRQYLVNAVADVVNAGADVIYLDQTNGALGKFFVNGMTSTMGVVQLEKDLLAAYPNIALETEQFNPMASSSASFALTTVNLGDPLSGYIFNPFVKVVPEGYYYQPTDVLHMNQFENWGFFTPGASSDETWLQIAGAFQQYDLLPDSRLARNANQLSGFSGPNGVTAFFEETGTTRSFVVYRPGQSPLTFGQRYTNITQWSGPGYLKDWLIYSGNTMLGLDPNQTYVFDSTVTLSQSRFHLTSIPADFAGYQDDNHRILPQEAGLNDSNFRMFFTGNGTVTMFVPDVDDVYLNNQQVNVNRTTHTASITVAASGTNYATLRVFQRTDTTLTGKWASLPWSVPTHLSTYFSTSGTLYPPDGFFTAVTGVGFFIGKLPTATSIHFVGSYKMRDDAFNSKGDGVIRINGTEVMRVSPGSGPPYASPIPYDVDVTAFAGKYVMIELLSDGEIHGPDYADWVSPQTVVTQPAPQATGASYDNSVKSNKLSFQFNQDINTSASAISVKNLATNAAIPTGLYNIDHTNDIATFFFNGPIADGNYRATLSASGVTNLAGNPMSAPYTFDFFSLTGDANHDRVVNGLDFNILATHFGQSGTFGDGNFNYDGTIDTLDFAALASHFGTRLAGAASVQSVPAVASTTVASLFSNGDIRDGSLGSAATDDGSAVL